VAATGGRDGQRPYYWQGVEAHWVHTQKKTYRYRERDEVQRQAFLKQLARYTPEEVVYVDESGADDNEDSPYGWCVRAERFYAERRGNRTCRISMIAGWCDRQVLAPMTFQGHCNTALVETWVERFLVPALTPGQVVVMDNARFHQSATIRELIETAGCRLLFLPTYSPDLNKIEKFWARLKRYLRQTLHDFENFWDAVDNAFKAMS
jgi:transposase